MSRSGSGSGSIDGQFWRTVPAERAAAVRELILAAGEHAPPAPKLAASVVLLRSSPQGGPRQIFLARRSASLSFLGGFDSFPGGRVEVTDPEVPASGPTCDDLAFRVAALRELFEETKVLCAEHTDGTPARLTHEERADLHARALAGEPFAHLLRQRGLRLKTAELLPFGHWVTPPYTAVRFDTIFYALELPEGETPVVDPGELSIGDFYTAAEACQLHEQGRLFLTFPTLETLRLLILTDDDLGAAARLAREREPATSHLVGGELAVGVRAFPGRAHTLPPATHTNAFVLGGEELVVVDPGTPFADEQETLCAQIDALLRQGRRLKEIWLTHHHPDHVGGVIALRQRYGVGVAAHRAAVLPPDIVPDRFIAEGDETTLALGGGRKAVWRALHTPGHSPDHLCFYEQSRELLLSGDLVLGVGTAIVAPPEGDMRSYLASLERLLGLPTRFIFPGHGPPIGAPHDRIKKYLSHRRERETSILELLRQTPGGLSPEEIVPHVYRELAPTAHILAAFNVQAHLDKLAQEGRVREEQGRFVAE